MTVTVGEFEGREEEWDRFASGAPGATLCHRYGWRRVMEEALGHQCLWLAARAPDGSLAGLLPLVRVRSRLFGHYLVSLPFLNYGGPIGAPEAVGALAERAVELARAGGVKLLELRNRSEAPVDLAVSHRKITVVLDLPDTAEALMKAFPSKLRSQVRRPAKEGVTVRFGPDQVEPFYRVFARHMRDLGTPVMPRAFFDAVLEAVPGSWFGCAWLGDVPVACGAGFVWGDELEMTWASSLSAYSRIAPNMGLYHAFMLRAIEAGLARFNFGRCTPGGGTHRFKAQWGGRDEPLWWYQWSPIPGTGESTPSPDAGPWAWGPRLWKRLPLPVANWLGPRIVRSIP